MPLFCYNKIELMQASLERSLFCRVVSDLKKYGKTKAMGDERYEKADYAGHRQCNGNQGI